MTINIRTLQSLTRDFLDQHPELRLNLSSSADTDRDGELGEANITIRNPDNSETTHQINEVEFLLYLHRLEDRSTSPQLTGAQRAQAFGLLRSRDGSSVQAFLAERQAGRLNGIDAEARAWEERVDQALTSMRLSLRVYNTLPRPFLDHIAPNYYRHLALAASLDADSNAEVTVQEITNTSIQNRDQQNQARFTALDTNHDSHISLEEFRLLARAEGLDPNAPQIEARFNSLDADHQNGLSLAELNRMSPSDAVFKRQAQELIVNATQELAQVQQRLGPTLSEQSELGRLSSRLALFDLSYIDPRNLTTAALEENNIFRLLNWMKTLSPNQTFISAQRVDELFQERAMDTSILIGEIRGLCRVARARADQLSPPPPENPPPNAPARPTVSPADQTLATELRRNAEILNNFGQRFASISSHHILTETVLTEMLASPLALNEVKTAIESLINSLIQSNPPQNAQLQQRFRVLLHPLLRLAGANSTPNHTDSILTRDDLVILLAKDRLKIILGMTPHAPQFANEDAVNEALTVVVQEYMTNRIAGGNDGVFRRVREEGLRKGLSTSTIDHIISHIRRELAKTTLEVHERPHFLDPLWRGFSETQIANPDFAIYPLSIGEETRPLEGNQFLARALIHYAFHHPQNTLEIVQRTERNELFFLIEHVIAGGIRDRARAHAGDGVHGALHYLSYPVLHFTNRTWRQRNVDNAEAQHQTRLQAVQALRARLEGGNNDASLADAVAGLQNEEQRRILTEELHVQELERIYYIPNSAEQEIAFTRFATYTLRDQVNPERGILSAFRSRFGVTNIHSPRDLIYNQWQLRNGPAAATIYDRLIRYSEHTDIRNQAVSDRFDLRGNGGDFSPLHWGVEFSDDEASIDGVWDVVMQQVMISGFIAGTVRTGQALLGMGGILNRAFTGVEFMLGWRNHSNLFARILYWPARALSEIANIPLHRELSSEMNIIMRNGVATSEVEMRMADVLRNVQRTSWNNRLGSFFWNQAANLQANSLLFNRNTQNAAANLLRLSQTMLRISEESFSTATRLLGEARTISRAGGLNPQKLTEIEALLARAADHSRQGHALRELAITQQGSIGLRTPASAASESLSRAVSQAESIQDAARAANLEGRMVNINTHLGHLQTTGQRIEGLSVHQAQLASRGALGGVGLYGLAALAENRAAATAAAQMVNPAAILAQNPAMQGQWQLYFLGWKMLHDQTLSAEYRNNPTLREWALTQGINAGEVSQDVLQQAYEAQSVYRGSRSVYLNAFLNPLREGPAREAEPIRPANLPIPTSRPNPNSESEPIQ